MMITDQEHLLRCGLGGFTLAGFHNTDADSYELGEGDLITYVDTLPDTILLAGKTYTFEVINLYKKDSRGFPYFNAEYV